MTAAATLAPFAIASLSRFDAGAMRLSFANVSGTTFAVLADTSAAATFNNWIVLDPATGVFTGQLRFIDLPATNSP